jgi:hypothetical protein
MMCLWASDKKKIWKKMFCFASLISMKKGVGSGVVSGAGDGSGSISQRYRSGDPDLDPHQTVTEPQYYFLGWNFEYFCKVFGVADERMGEELTAWIRLTEGSQLTQLEFRAFCKGKVKITYPQCCESGSGSGSFLTP